MIRAIVDFSIKDSGLSLANGLPRVYSSRKKCGCQGEHLQQDISIVAHTIEK